MEREKKNPNPQISYILVERKKQTKYVKYIICLTVLILRNRRKIKCKEENLQFLTGELRSGLVWSVFQKLQEEIESRSHMRAIYAGGSNSKYRGPAGGACLGCSAQHCRREASQEEMIEAKIRRVMEIRPCSSL